MRPGRLLPIALTLSLLLGAPPSFGSQAQGQLADGGGGEPTAAAAAQTESLPARVGKALVFGVVVSVLLLGGGLWQRSRRKRMKMPQR